MVEVLERVKKQSRTIPKNIEIILAARSGALCALCKIYLMPSTGVWIGEKAHIVPFSSKGPRGDIADDLRDEKIINHYDNIVILCPNCHTTVDKDTATYTVKYLKQVKIDHEQYILNLYSKASITIKKQHINSIISTINTGINSNEHDQQVNNIHLIDITEKIKINKLTQKTQQMLDMGFTQSASIKKCIEDNNKTFSNQWLYLTNFTKTLYYELLLDGKRGDELFTELYIVLRKSLAPDPDSANFNITFIVICGILTYLFEHCEILEKS